MEWIDVKESLPISDYDVIIHLRVGTIFMGKYIGDHLWMFYFSNVGLDNCERRSKEVTHWMPLPEPPKVNPINS